MAWQKKAKLTKEQRGLGFVLGQAALKTGVGELHWPDTIDRWYVKLTRLSTHMIDSDNVVGAFKGIRDGIADALETNDKWNGKIVWEYDQIKHTECVVRMLLSPKIPAYMPPPGQGKLTIDGRTLGG